MNESFVCFPSLFCPLQHCLFTRLWFSANLSGFVLTFSLFHPSSQHVHGSSLLPLAQTKLRLTLLSFLALCTVAAAQIVKILKWLIGTFKWRKREKAAKKCNCSVWLSVVSVDDLLTSLTSKWTHLNFILRKVGVVTGGKGGKWMNEWSIWLLQLQWQTEKTRQTSGQTQSARQRTGSLPSHSQTFCVCLCLYKPTLWCGTPKTGSWL